MKTVGVIKQKGGAGATTLVVHLALAAHNTGFSTCIFDTDPQGSAQAWAAMRGGAEPLVVPLPNAEGLREALKAAAADGRHLVFMDTQPRHEAASAAVARASDLCLIPTKVGPFDIGALPETAALIKATKTPALVVLNDVPREGPEEDEARAAIAGLELQLWSGLLHSRKTYRNTVGGGRTVFDPLSRSDWRGLNAAATEIAALWGHVRATLGM